MKAVLRGKFIAVNALIKKLERIHTINLTAHLKVLQQKEANITNRSRLHEIDNLKAEINKLAAKSNQQKSKMVL
jgi:phosphoribosyl-dephospho-CoA transferase